MQTMMRGKTHHKRALVQNECSGIRRFYCQSLPLLIVEIWQRNDVSDVNLPSLLIPALRGIRPTSMDRGQQNADEAKNFLPTRSTPEGDLKRRYG
jgi:hypothetical protein